MRQSNASNFAFVISHAWDLQNSLWISPIIGGWGKVGCCCKNMLMFMGGRVAMSSERRHEERIPKVVNYFHIHIQMLYM